MFWLILFGIFCIIGILGVTKVSLTSNSGRILSLTGLYGSFCSFIMVFIFFFSGITDYPRLIQERESVRVFQARVYDIRHASYRYRGGSKFVVGSIKNFKQSTVLSGFIKDLAEKESDYNERLITCKVYREEFLLWFFLDGFFISDKIDEMLVVDLKKL